MKKVIIQGELMDLNNFIRVNRANKFAGASAKRTETAKAAAVFKEHINDLLPLRLPISIEYTWIMSNRRKDKDNIAFAQKFVQDAMIESGVLENDGWNEIDGFSHKFKVDKDNPRVEIKIKEAK